MVTGIERAFPLEGKWRKFYEIKQGRYALLTNNLPDGQKEVYVFGCDDDNELSYLLKINDGVDVHGRTFREIMKNPDE